MSERNTIDEAFRKKLAGREVPVAPGDWQHMEAMLLKAAKNQRRGWRRFWWMLAVLTVCTAACWWSITMFNTPVGVENEKALSQNEEHNPTIHDSLIRAHTSMSDSTAMPRSASDRNEGFDADGNVVPGADSTARSNAGSREKQQGITAPTSTEKGKKSADTSGLSNRATKASSNTNISQNNPAKDAAFGAQSNLDKSTAMTPAATVPVDTEKDKTLSSLSPTENTSQFAPQALSTALSTDRIEKKSGSETGIASATPLGQQEGTVIQATANPDAEKTFFPLSLKQGGFPSPRPALQPGRLLQMPSVTNACRWTLRIGANGALVRPVLTNTSAGFRAERTDALGTTFGAGFTAELERNAGPWQLFTGVHAQQWTEVYSYNGFRSSERDSSFMRLTLVQTTDTIMQNGQIIIVQVVDSVEVMADTTITDLWPLNASGAGAVSWTNLSIPLGFGRRLWTGRKSSFWVRSAVRVDWNIARRGVYLREDRNAADTEGWVRWNVSGMLAVEWRRSFWQNKAYWWLAPDVRYTFGSWQERYGQRYWMPGISVGVGWNW